MQHTEECLRFGFSKNCPVCKMIEAKEMKSEKEELKEHRRYRHAIPWRKF